MELLCKKLSIIKEMNSITNKLFSDVVNENIDELEESLEKRQALMDQIDEIDCKLSTLNKVENDNTEVISKEIKSQLKDIINMDSEITLLIAKKEREFRRKFTEIDLKIKTGNYDVEESEKKPKGYFLNTKS